MSDKEHWWGDVVREPIRLAGAYVGERIIQHCRYCGLPRLVDRIEFDSCGVPTGIIPASQDDGECRKTIQLTEIGGYPILRF